MTNFEKVKDFHRVFGRTPDPVVPTIPNAASVEFRRDLITEEYKEVMDELGYSVYVSFYKISNYKIDVAKLGKELADLEYVVCGTAASFGIPHDEVFSAVHDSNMSKLDKDGKVIRREDGKVLKSELYQPADIEKVLREHFHG